MTFASVPAASRSQIKRAGEILTQGDISPIERDAAMRVADAWRACHAYPLNTFQMTLRAKLAGGSFGDKWIVAQRLKRMPTIIEKLKRFPDMKLTTMQDIGGVRAIVPSVKHVRRLADAYRKSTRLTHELKKENDYISQPREGKDRDGYRGIHLIYRCQYPRGLSRGRGSEYDGLLIEIQLRTELQHIWATAVETVEVLLNQDLKSRRGDQAWLDFFAAVSSVFAMNEGCQPVPGFSHLSVDETMAEVARREKELNALFKMSACAVGIPYVSGKEKASAWHLMVLDHNTNKVQIKRYDRESFEEANRDYRHEEEQIVAGARREAVLVSAGSLDKIKLAYPNWFMDLRVFVTQVKAICDLARKRQT